MEENARVESDAKNKYDLWSDEKSMFFRDVYSVQCTVYSTVGWSVEFFFDRTEQVK